MPQSPELAGGAGFTFEGAVGALYLVDLLGEGYAPGIDGRTVVRVAFQQRDFGEPLDDLIVDFHGAGGEIARLSLQVKRSLTISQAPSNTDFRDVVRDCWLTLAKTDFRRQFDRFGAAVDDVAKNKARALNTLCELARESTTTEHFQARFAPEGNASQDVREVRDVIQALIGEAKGTGCTDAEVHEYLKHFVLIEFDLLHAGAVDPPRAITRVRDCLLAAEADKAPLVWSNLIEMARDSAGKAGEYDRARLVRAISEVAGLRIATSLRADVEKIAALARSYADGIQDDIGGIKLDRKSLADELDAELVVSRLVQIQGLPGGGKSVLLRQRVQRALGEGSVLFLKADQLDGRNWIGFATAHGLSGAALQDLLVEIGATGTPVLFVDAIDRVEKEHQSILLDVLREIVHSPLLDNWRIVVSLRDAGIEMLRNWMAGILDRLSVSRITVGVLNDEEAEVIAIARPELRGLLFGAQSVREIVRRPFFAKVLQQKYAADTGGPPFTPQSEVDLIENWWARGGYNATGQDALARQRALVELATTRGRNLSAPIGIRLLSSAAQNLLDQLIVDGIVQHVRFGHTVRFAHDIYFEWAFFHALADRGDDWLEEIRAVGEPPAVARVVELLAQWEYAYGQDWGVHLARTVSSNMRSQWTRAWLLGPVGISNFSADTEQYRAVVFAENFRFMQKALVWFQAEKTTPNLNYLASNLPQDRKQRAADFFGWPSDYRAWGKLISFLLQGIADIPVRLYPDVLSVFEVWQNALAEFPNPTSQAILKKCAEWLADLDTAENERAPGEHSSRWEDLPGQGEFRKTLSALILSASRQEPALTEAYLRRLMTYERVLRDRFKDVAAFSRILAHTHANLLVDFTVTYLKEELPEDQVKREREEAARAAEYRKEVLAKPEAERTRFDQLALDSSPFLGMGSFSSHDWDSLCIDRDIHSFWPESPLREPFHSLFAASPDQALRLVRELCNHAITAWRQLHRFADTFDSPERTPLPLELAFPWGTQQFWGTDRQYLWSRAISAPKPLGCGFMALEEWCLAELSKGRPVDELIQKVVEDNECVAVLGTAVLVALQSEAVSEAVFPLVTSQRLLDADRNRLLQDHSALSIHLMGFQGKQEQDHVAAIRIADARDVRKKQLARQIPLFVFGGQQLSERTKVAIRDFGDNLPYEYAELRDVPEVRAELMQRAVKYAEMAETENYRMQKTAVPNQVAILHVSPSASQPEEVEKFEEATLYLKTGSLLAWASDFVEKGTAGTAYRLQSALAFAKTIDDATLFDTAADVEDRGVRRGAVAATAALALQYRSDCHDADLTWARDVVVRALQAKEMQDRFWTPAAIMPWHHAIFAARALAAELHHGTGDASAAHALLSLVAHPLEAASLAAMGEACRLWPKHPRITWAAFGLVFSLCHVPPRTPDRSRGPSEATHTPEQVNAAVEVAWESYDKGEGWRDLPLPPPAWIKVDARQTGGRNCRIRNHEYRDADLVNPEEVWAKPETGWYSQYAAKVLPLVPVEQILASEARNSFLDFISALLAWTIEKNAPPWVKPGRRDRGSSQLMEWTRALGRLHGNLAGYLPLNEVKSRFLDPVFVLEDETCWALLSPFCSSCICAYVYDAQEVPEPVVPMLDLCLGRLLAARELRQSSYRAGELLGFDLPPLARTLMFVSVEHAALSARYVNGDWSEIGRILPLVDRFIRAVGWTSDVMSSFLTLCERAKLSYPADVFAEQVLAILSAEGQLKGWHGSLIPARIAGLVQYLADRESPMPSNLAQNMLRILDHLVDMGDRRSAALQLGEAFREVRIE